MSTKGEDAWKDRGWKTAAEEYHANRPKTAERRMSERDNVGAECDVCHKAPCNSRSDCERIRRYKAERANGHASASAAVALKLVSSQRKPDRLPAALESAAASTIAVRGISWFWPGRFAIGKLGLIGGLPDKGKGLISADIIARCTTGGEWPCKEGSAPKGNVLWFTAEDDLEDTVVPRLIAAGAELDRVHIVTMARNPNGSKRMFNLASDLPLLEAKLQEIGDVNLVIIDPVSAYLGVGKINNSQTTDVRAVLAPLTKLAELKKLLVIGIMHFNKKADVTNAMLRIADSLAYVAAARHVYVVVDDSENDKARLFVKAKNNLAPDKDALRFYVGTRMIGADPDTHSEIWAPHVHWDSQTVEVTATEAMEAADGSGGARARRKEAEEFLQTRLAYGPVPQKDIEEEAHANCISRATLRRAKAELRVVATKERGKVSGGWIWELPKAPQYDRD
jgi:putative DNA primase/helicase